MDRNSGFRQHHLPVLPSLGSRRTSRAVGPEGEGCCHRILIESVMSMSHEIRKAISMNLEEKPGSRSESNSTPHLPHPHHWSFCSWQLSRPPALMQLKCGQCLHFEQNSDFRRPHSPLCSRHVDVPLMLVPPSKVCVWTKGSGLNGRPKWPCKYTPAT